MKMNKTYQTDCFSVRSLYANKYMGAMRLHLSKGRDIHEKRKDTETLLKVLKQP